jgi:hypothetical protein
MSDAGVIHDVSITLKSILDARLNSSGSAGRGARGFGSGGTSVAVTVDSPHRGSHEDLRVNLFLYQVLQDEGRRNSGGWIPLERTDRSQFFAPEPLALRLYYLLTAFAGDGLTEHHLLGEAIQALYVNRRVPEALLRGTLKDSPIRAEHVQLTLLNLDVDTLQKIWGSQTEPMRTSVAYEVEAVFIDADEAGAEVRLVEERVLDIVPVPYLSTVAPEAAAAGAVVRVFGANLALSSPTAGPGLLKIWFGKTEAEVLPDNRSGGAVSVKVPAGLSPGPVRVRAQLDRYFSQSVPFDVLAPA